MAAGAGVVVLLLVFAGICLVRRRQALSSITKQPSADEAAVAAAAAGGSGAGGGENSGTVVNPMSGSASFRSPAVRAALPDDLSGDGVPVSRLAALASQPSFRASSTAPNASVRQVAAGSAATAEPAAATGADQVSPLPPGWSEAWSNSKQRTYFRHTDGRTSWSRPSPDALPEGWQSSVDPDSGATYFTAPDGSTTWEKPAPAAAPPSSAAALPEHWTEAWSKSKNRPYYKNSQTGETSWTRPDGAAHATQAAAASGGGDAAPLPEGWTEHFSKSKQLPYWRAADGTTTWHRPA